MSDIINIDSGNDNFEQPTVKGKRNRDKSTYALSGKSKDPDKEAKKAELFKRLTELHLKQGIPKFSTVDEMSLLIEEYFVDCTEFQLRPTVRGLALALGTVYDTLNGWERGERDAQLGSSCSAIIKKAKQLIAEYDEVMALEGYDNPILFMFRAKNYYGMQDKQEVVIQGNQSLGESLTAEEIAKRVGLPDNHGAIDVEWKE
jgi:hypothetical protein